MEKINIDQLYYRLLPRMEVLEQERIALNKKLENLKKISIGVTCILLIGIGYLMAIFWGALLAAVLGITFYTLMYHRMIGDYRKNYKTKVFSQLVEELGPSYKYTLDGNLDEELIKNSGIFHEFTKVKSEDLIEGHLYNHSFQMAETNLWYHKRKDDDRPWRDSDRGEAYSYIFKGLFFVGKIPQKFPTSIWILSKDHPKVHPVSRVRDGWQKVRVDHSAFRLEYDVYAEDKEIAQQILQSSTLDTIMETKEKVVDPNMRLELSFQQNNVYLSISTIKELFEPPVETPVTDKEDFMANFKYLVNTTGLIQQLTLAKPQVPGIFQRFMNEMESMWDNRYANENYAYGTNPNNFFKEILDSLRITGNILLPAEGEGRNAVYAAKKGLKAYAFDISEEGRKKALKLAKKENVEINYEVGDFNDLSLINEKFDVAGLIYAHFTPPLLSKYHKKIAQMIKPGGFIILGVCRT